MTLTELYIDQTRVTDLSPVSGMPLTVFYCTMTPVTDLAPLAGMPLEKIRCGRNGYISDLRTLNHRTLWHFAVKPCSVTRS